VGGSKRAGTYSKHLGVPMVLCYKLREKANEVSEMKIIGKVTGKNVIILDDMVDTAGTMTKAAGLMMEYGAKSVRAIVTHAIMSPPATQRIKDSQLTEIIFTDSIPYNKECEKVRILSIADLFADTIQKVFNNESISSQYLL
jgi:ribose-phosphate pyrophosphokinase